MTNSDTEQDEVRLKECDELHRWEVEPHPYSRDYDYFVTDDDHAARDAILHAAEMYLWDENEGEERTLRVRMNKDIAAAPVSSPVSTADDSFRDLLPLTAVRVAPGEYEVKSRDGRVLWRMEGAALADWVCASVNGYDAAINALPATSTTPVDGEQEGKGNARSR